MNRSKRIIFLSHCILNQNTVVYPLARAKGAYRQIIDNIMDLGIGIHQLPCPEFIYLGLNRKPMNKEEYDNKEFRLICKDISMETIKVMKEYMDNGYEVIGLLGINQSPTCSIRAERGILMEEILAVCKEAEVDINTLDVSINYVDGEDNTTDIEDLKRFVK